MSLPPNVVKRIAKEGSEHSQMGDGVLEELTRLTEAFIRRTYRDAVLVSAKDGTQRVKTKHLQAAVEKKQTDADLMERTLRMKALLDEIYEIADKSGANPICERINAWRNG